MKNMNIYQKGHFYRIDVFVMIAKNRLEGELS